MDVTVNAGHYYEMLLASCERLFSNEIEQHAFEDQMRAAFGTKVSKFRFLAEEAYIKD